MWSEPVRAQALGRERAGLARIVEGFDRLDAGLEDAGTLLALAEEESDAETVAEVDADVAALGERLGALEFRRMFAGEMDPSNAFLDVQAGSGGTEAQDWAEMLLRMYLRWGERRGFETELIEVSAGEVAGIKSATVRFEGGVRLRLAAHRERRPPAREEVAFRFRTPAPHLVRGGVRLAGGR